MTEKNKGCYHSGRFTQYRKAFITGTEEFGTDKINCLAIDGSDKLYVGTDNGLFQVEAHLFVKIFDGRVQMLKLLSDGTLAVGSDSTLYFWENGALRKMRQFDDPLVSVADNRGTLWILTENRLCCTDRNCVGDFSKYLEGGKGLSLAVSDREIYVATETNISVVHGKRREWKNILPMFSNMPAPPIHVITFDDAGYLWLGTDEGAAIHDNASLWLTADKVHGLPKNPVYRIVTDKVGGRYFATDVGVVYQKNGSLKYFSAERWVPDNNITDVAVTADGSVIYAATARGIAKLEAFTSTLAEKAEHYEELIEKYHIRRGFTATRHIENHDMNTGFPEISDNDGLWTGCYVAAESYRYAATGSADALRRARRGMNAMLFLIRISGIPGFTARAVRYPGEIGYGNGNHEWTLSPDGSCEWKGETSSDEMTGHFFGLSTYYDLCADDAEKEDVGKALCGIVDHILTHSYRLVDKDGLPTTWAAWDPALLNYDDKWFSERGINSLEFLGFLKVAYHVSGDEKYKAVYDEFVIRHHYPLNAMHHKVRDAHLVHIDDNLAFLASATLLRLEDNQAIRSLLLCGMADHWEYERVERQPLFCFLHAAFTGWDVDLLEGVQSLREMPYDLMFYRSENSKRKDIVYDTEQAAWFEDPQPLEALPYDERNISRPDGGAFQVDSGRDRGSQEGTVFLLPYWIARYYGLLAEDEE